MLYCVECTSILLAVMVCCADCTYTQYNKTPLERHNLKINDIGVKAGSSKLVFSLVRITGSQPYRFTT